MHSRDDYWKLSFSSSQKTYYNVVWNKLYKKEIFNHIRFPEGKINEDIQVMYQIVSACDKIMVSDRVGYNYLLRKGSIMKSKRTIAHLAGPEGFLQWAEGFYLHDQWEFANKSFQICMHWILTKDYGDNWRKHPEYIALRSRIGDMYQKLLKKGVVNKKWKMIMTLYRYCEPAASRIYKKSSLITNEKEGLL